MNPITVSSPSSSKGEKQRPTTADAVSSIWNLVHYLEPYKIAIFGLLIPYIPLLWRIGWDGGLGSHYPAEFWYQGTFLLSLTIVGFIAPTSTFSGPLRFAYNEGNTLVTSFCENLPTWSPHSILLALVFIPMARVWVVAVVPIAWQYILSKYRIEVNCISDQAEDLCSRALLAVEAARKHTIEANGYERAALEVAVAARRDARLAQVLRITDYFDVATDSWSALGQITAPVESTARCARKVLEEAEACRDVELDDNDDEEGGAEGKDDSLAAMFLESAKAAVDTVEKMEAHAREAQAKVTESRNAQQRDTTSRRTEIENSRAVLVTAKNLMNSVANLSATLSEAEKGYKKTKWFSAQARTAALEGNFDTAASRIGDAEREANKTVDAEQTLSSATNAARSILRELHLGE